LLKIKKIAASIGDNLEISLLWVVGIKYIMCELTTYLIVSVVFVELKLVP
jgi:hypothetical protein